MQNIDNEIILIKNKITEGFMEPFADKDLTKFIFGSSKMIRSRLAIYYLKAHNVEICNCIISILAAGEIIHNASLLHDDVLDNANTRRNQTTIGYKYNDKISILAGDYLTTLAIDKLLNIENSQILNLFKTCIQAMSLAEIEQYFLRGKIPTLEKYLDICSKKTGLLFSTILESCAILSNLDINLAQEFGKEFGTLFQIKNDLDKTSAKYDEFNKQYTIKEILSIEKTSSLLDDYKESLYKLLKNLPNNLYRESLIELIRTT